MQQDLFRHVRGDLLVEIDECGIERRVKVVLGAFTRDIISQTFPTRLEPRRRFRNLAPSPIDRINLFTDTEKAQSERCPVRLESHRWAFVARDELIRPTEILGGKETRLAAFRLAVAVSCRLVRGEHVGIDGLLQIVRHGFVLVLELVDFGFPVALVFRGKLDQLDLGVFQFGRGFLLALV
jgi:hypothetical protein